MSLFQFNKTTVIGGLIGGLIGLLISIFLPNKCRNFIFIILIILLIIIFLIKNNLSKKLKTNCGCFTPDQLLNPIINFKLEDFDKKTQKSIRGLVICHGRASSADIFKKFKNIEWYMVDIDNDIRPDYVCDARSVHHMSYFPNEYFDIALTANYPIGFDKIGYLDVLANISRIIKSDGHVYLSEFPSLIYHYLSETDRQVLLHLYSPIIKETYQNKNLSSLITYLATKSYNNDIFNTFILVNMTQKHNNWIVPTPPITNDNIYQRAHNMSTHVLQKYFFKYVDCNNDFFIVKKSKI